MSLKLQAWTRFGTRLLTFLAAAWLLATGAFLFVKGLDISLVACDERTCGDVADLVPGIVSFVVGVGMLLAWPFVASISETSWSRRLGIGLLFGSADRRGTRPYPILAVTERLGIPFWVCVDLDLGDRHPPPDHLPAISRSEVGSRGDRILGRGDRRRRDLPGR